MFLSEECWRKQGGLVEGREDASVAQSYFIARKACGIVGHCVLAERSGLVRRIFLPREGNICFCLAFALTMALLHKRPQERHQKLDTTGCVRELQVSDESICGSAAYRRTGVAWLSLTQVLGDESFDEHYECNFRLGLRRKESGDMEATLYRCGNASLKKGKNSCR